MSEKQITSDSIVKRGMREISTTACGSWRQPLLIHKFAASHGSARRRRLTANDLSEVIILKKLSVL